ncbi:MAG: TetR family transcriptional regulator C-terminal domain-containing protein [Sphingomonadales bacterium]
MGRSIEFEPNEVVLKAMAVFWRQGYERTSIGDLEISTGIGRKSLYRTFHDKETLFLAVLQRYRAVLAAERLAPLLRPQADLQDIEDLLRSLADLSGTPAGDRGCLICNTAVELATDMPQAAKEVDAYFSQIHKAMRNALEGACKKGQVGFAPSQCDQQANFLLAILQSLCVLARARATTQMLNEVVSSAIEHLKR